MPLLSTAEEQHTETQQSEQGFHLSFVFPEHRHVQTLQRDFIIISIQHETPFQRCDEHPAGLGEQHQPSAVVQRTVTPLRCHD